MNRNLRLVLTAGDPNGIGPEVLLRSLASLYPFDGWEPVVVGNRNAMVRSAEVLSIPGITHSSSDLFVQGVSVPIVDVEGDVGWNPGSISSEAGRVSGESVVRGVELVLEGDADGIVTMPISKEAWNAGGFAWPGHTELISSLCGGIDGLMILMCPKIRVAMLTGHLPLSEVSVAIDRERIVDRATTFSGTLAGDFGIESPEIALLGLNPHAGDGGVLGSEEQEVYQPALEALNGSGVRVSGPFPADAFFARGSWESFDGILASYHDQGLIPMKMLAAGDGVNFTAGLPIVRTSPDHGTAFNIAGRGLASAESSIAAIRTALQVIRNRRGKEVDRDDSV